MHSRALRTTTAAAGTLLALLLTTACSDDGDAGSGGSTAAPAAASPSPAAPSGPAAADGGSYPSTEAILEALNAAGLPCEEPQEGTFTGVSDARSCIFDGTEDVVLLRFANDGERADYVENKEELASAVLGQDWAVETVLPDTAQRIADALGGEVLRGATS